MYSHVNCKTPIHANKNGFQSLPTFEDLYINQGCLPHRRQSGNSYRIRVCVLNVNMICLFVEGVLLAKLQQAIRNSASYSYFLNVSSTLDENYENSWQPGWTKENNQDTKTNFCLDSSALDENDYSNFLIEHTIHWKYNKEWTSRARFQWHEQKAKIELNWNEMLHNQ